MSPSSTSTTPSSPAPSQAFAEPSFRELCAAYEAARPRVQVAESTRLGFLRYVSEAREWMEAQSITHPQEADWERYREWRQSAACATRLGATAWNTHRKVLAAVYLQAQQRLPIPNPLRTTSPTLSSPAPAPCGAQLSTRVGTLVCVLLAGHAGAHSPWATNLGVPACRERHPRLGTLCQLARGHAEPAHDDGHSEWPVVCGDAARAGPCVLNEGHQGAHLSPNPAKCPATFELHDLTAQCAHPPGHEGRHANPLVLHLAGHECKGCGGWGETKKAGEEFRACAGCGGWGTNLYRVPPAPRGETRPEAQRRPLLVAAVGMSRAAYLLAAVERELVAAAEALKEAKGLPLTEEQRASIHALATLVGVRRVDCAPHIVDGLHAAILQAGELHEALCPRAAAQEGGAA